MYLLFSRFNLNDTALTLKLTLIWVIKFFLKIKKKYLPKVLKRVVKFYGKLDLLST